MHGLVNRALQEFVKDTYGADIWGEVRDQAALPFDEFESMLHYDIRLTRLTIDAASAVLHKDAASLLEDVGSWLVSNPAQESIRRLLRFGGTTFLDFLQSLEELPGRARMALPDLDMPEIVLQTDTPGRFRLEIRWVLDGMGSVLLGALRGMADDYGALVVLEAEPGREGAEIVVIDLLDAQFAAGRTFELDAQMR